MAPPACSVPARSGPAPAHAPQPPPAPPPPGLHAGPPRLPAQSPPLNAHSWPSPTPPPESASLLRHPPVSTPTPPPPGSAAAPPPAGPARDTAHPVSQCDPNPNPAAMGSAAPRPEPSQPSEGLSASTPLARTRGSCPTPAFLLGPGLGGGQAGSPRDCSPNRHGVPKGFSGGALTPPRWGIALSACEAVGLREGTPGTSTPGP